MKCKIETSNGIMFLKGIYGDKRLEIADYIELHDSSLLMISLILDKKEYFYWGRLSENSQIRKRELSICNR